MIKNNNNTDDVSVKKQRTYAQVVITFYFKYYESFRSKIRFILSNLAHSVFY